MSTIQNASTYINKVVIRRNLFLDGHVVIGGIAVEFADKSPNVLLYGTRGSPFSDPYYETYASFVSVSLSAPSGFDEIKLGYNNSQNWGTSYQNIGLFLNGSLVNEYKPAPLSMCCILSPSNEWAKENYTISLKSRPGFLINGFVVEKDRITSALPLQATDGGWSEWGEPGACSVACGGGTANRQRACINPEPTAGGADCVGPNYMDEACNTNPCPIDGGLSEWTEWGDCVLGENRVFSSQRLRYCNNPPAQYGGEQCHGAMSNTRTCDSVSGGWGDWDKQDCIKQADNTYMRQMSRYCNNPEPKYGGAPCSGAKTQMINCIPTHATNPPDTPVTISPDGAVQPLKDPIPIQTMEVAPVPESEMDAGSIFLIILASLVFIALATAGYRKHKFGYVFTISDGCETCDHGADNSAYVQ